MADWMIHSQVNGLYLVIRNLRNIATMNCLRYRGCVRKYHSEYDQLEAARVVIN